MDGDQLLMFVKVRLVEPLEATTTVEITVHAQKVKGIAIVIPNVRVALHVSMM